MEENDDAAVLAEAQKALLARRRDLGVTQAPPIEADKPDFKRALDQSVGPKIAGARRCGLCGEPVDHPGVCAACGRKLDAAVLGETTLAAIEREIPARFQWAMFSDAKLYQRVAGGDKVVMSARRALASGAPVVVLLGPGRAGKSTIAAAWLRMVLTSGSHGARWVASRDLASDEAPEGRGLPIQRAIAATELVLDDLGAELATAPVGSGLAAQRIEAATRLVCERYDRNRLIVVTTAIGADLPRGDTRPLRRALAAVYGDNVAGRLYEHAAVVRVGGADRAGEQAAELSAAVAGSKTFRPRAGDAL